MSAPPRTTPVYDDDLGEFGIRVWIFGQLRVPEAATAGAGWDGDRYLVFRTSDDALGLVWASVWDTPADARLFLALLDRVIAQRRVVLGSAAATRTLVSRMLTVDGRPVVVFANVPRTFDWGTFDERTIQFSIPTP